MFEEADNLADIFRGGLPYYLLIVLPILILCSSNPVLASSEFAVQRMSQFDVHGKQFGCRSSGINLEGKSLYSWSTSRHCVVTRLQDLTVNQFHEIRLKAGGLVILLPNDISQFGEDVKQQIYQLEHLMLTQATSIPVYFSRHDKNFEQVIADLQRSATAEDYQSASHKQRESALSEIMNSISANGYQIVISGGSHTTPNKQSKIPIIQGELAPMMNIKTVGDVDVNSKLPLVVITANLKTFGLYNDYLNNPDTAVLLTLAELFSKLYSTSNAAPKYRLLFLISESGSLLNFQAMKKWVEENYQTPNIDFVLCLDAINQALSEDQTKIFMHVSKPPKEGTPMNVFYKNLKSIATKYDNVSVEGVHKKISTSEEMAWEHERFTYKRLPAFTLSSVKSHKDPMRTTIFQEDNESNIRNTQRKAKIIAESLARSIYNVDDGEIFTGAMDISSQMIKSWMHVKSILHNNDLKNAFEKYLKNVKVTYEKTEPRDPDFLFYDSFDGVLNVYSVKPAVFDLFLTILITAYLFSVYFVILYFPHLYTVVCRMSKESMKTKVN